MQIIFHQNFTHYNGTRKSKNWQDKSNSRAAKFTKSLNSIDPSPIASLLKKRQYLFFEKKITLWVRCVCKLRETYLFHEWLIETGFKVFSNTLSKLYAAFKLSLDIHFAINMPSVARLLVRRRRTCF